MASKEELYILKVIQQKRKEAKQQKQKIPFYLADDEPGYEKAINSVESTGAWATVISIATIVTSLALYMFSGQWDSGNVLFYIEVGCLVTCAVLGFNLYWLRVTPRFILTSLILILITSLVACTGIFPLITAIMAVITIVRWSTYKEWFYSMRPSRRIKAKVAPKASLNRVAKTVALKTQPKKSLSAVKAKKPVWLIVSLIVAIVVAIGGSVGFYFLGRSHGYDSGYTVGAEDGWNTGRSDGWQAGRSSGFNSGYDAGKEAGYKSGYYVGYSDGLEYANCVVWGGSYWSCQ